MNYYVHRALFKIGFFKKVNVTTSVTINGRLFRVPVVREAGYHNLMRRDVWLFEVLERLLAARPGAVVDVGMNIGQTLLKVASIDAERRYLGFEPNPLCYFTCKEIVAANQLRASEIFPVGLSDRTQLLPLFMDTDYAPGASVLEHFREDTKRFHQRVNVALFRGDEVVAIRRERAIAVVKIDVEGAELEVVRGLHDTISRARPHIVLEILPVYSLGKPNGRYRKERQDALVSALGDLGYRMFLIRERERRFELLADIPVHGDMSRTNYLFVHRDVTGEIDLERNPSFRALA